MQDSATHQKGSQRKRKMPSSELSLLTAGGMNMLQKRSKLDIADKGISQNEVQKMVVDDWIDDLEPDKPDLSSARLYDLARTKKMLKKCTEEIDHQKKLYQKTLEAAEKIKLSLENALHDRDAVNSMLKKTLRNLEQERQARDKNSYELKELEVKLEITSEELKSTKRELEKCEKIIAQNQKDPISIAFHKLQDEYELLIKENRDLRANNDAMKKKMENMESDLKRSKYYDAEGNLIAEPPKLAIAAGSSKTAQLRNRRKKILRAHQKARAALQDVAEENMPQNDKKKRKRYFPQQKCTECMERLPIFCMNVCGHKYCGHCIAEMAQKPHVEAVETVTCKKCSLSNGKPLHIKG